MSPKRAAAPGDLIKINEDAGWGYFPPFEDSSELHSRADAHFKRFSKQGWWALVSALGLRSGLASTFISLPRVRHIGLWRGKDSSVSCGSVHALEDQLAGLDAQVNEFELAGGEIPAGHHILTSFDAMVTFALALKQEWKARSND